MIKHSSEVKSLISQQRLIQTLLTFHVFTVSLFKMKLVYQN